MTIKDICYYAPYIKYDVLKGVIDVLYQYRRFHDADYADVDLMNAELDHLREYGVFINVSDEDVEAIYLAEMLAEMRAGYAYFYNIIIPYIWQYL